MAQVQEVTGFMGRNRKQPLADVTPQDLTGRERVLKSAARLLLDVGYQRMTLSRISEESGVGGLEIRRWYKTKDEILAALSEQLKRLILTQALEIFGVPEKRSNYSWWNWKPKKRNCWKSGSSCLKSCETVEGVVA